MVNNEIDSATASATQLMLWFQ